MSSSSYKKYFDPAQVESDQKDLVISQLKAELFELRQNEKDYDDLRAKLNNLEHRYELLQEEKVLNEREFKNRHEMNMKTINNLKGDIDSLKQELNVLNTDVQDIRLDNNGINEVINNRSSEIARLKAEITDLADNNNRIQYEKRDLEGQLNRLRNENRDHTHENDDIQNRVAEQGERRNKNERLIKELEIEREKADRQNQDLNREGDSLRLEIRNKNEAIKYSENVLSDNRKQIIALEADLNDLRRINEKTKNDTVQSQKSQQNEFQKNLEAQSKLNALETNIKDREDEIGQSRGHYEELKRDHLKLIDTNDDLNHDIEAAVRHLDLLSLQNNELIAEIQRFNEQDEKIRQALDRRDRVYEVKNRTETKMKQSSHALSSSLRSPSKRRDDI